MKISKDHLGALMLLGLGAAVVAVGIGYRIGTLNRAGAGFVPVVLGVLMMAVGILIGITSAGGRLEMVNPLPGHEKHGDRGPDWRGWGCILGGVLAFVVLGHWGGLVPATFFAVFVSALGDRDNTLKGAATLSAMLTVFCVIVFHYGLTLQLPLFQWGG